ncbi:MAG: SpoIIE family protein phosphatase [Cytophagales bacterium]|nr:SpoIIE family protein phosphatase [Cytophagales bacterium]
MSSQKNILRLFIILGVFSWLLMLGSGHLYRFGQIHHTSTEVDLFFTKAFLIAFIVVIYFFYRRNIGSQEGFNIIDLLWKVFVTGLIATVVSLSSNFLMSLLKDQEHGRNPYFLDTLYYINVGLITTFLIATFTVCKRLILYQKSKRLIRTWNVFEYGLLGSSLLFFTNLNIYSGLGWFIQSLLALLAIVLSVNLKWVAYLSFKQKWKSILLIILIGLYIGYFYTILNGYEESNGFVPVFSALKVFSINALYFFALVYCVFSVLVILFNLPTSSVFEQKIVEAVNFQRLSQSRNTGQNEDQVFEILIDSAASVSVANAAWLDILDENEDVKKTLFHKTGQREKEIILKSIKTNQVKGIKSSVPSRNIKKNRFVAEIKHEVYRSIFVIPVFIQDKQVAVLSLVKDVNDGFNKETIEIIRTFINQASISIENYRLMEEAIINERYKEELKIAKQVQDSLLPKHLSTIDGIEMSAFSKPAAEVGGDYFDTYKMSDSRIALVIGDVSGKGTSAAFHMSQMKGIFQSLVQLNISAREFIIKANNALSSCLDRTSFITTTYFIIDGKEKKFEFSRAGHCPTLYFSEKDKKVKFLEDNGLGLGILRDDQFNDFVEVNEIGYNSGDVLFLYTDGITEAKNQKHEEFGYERLMKFLEKNAFYSADYIKEEILKTLYDFCGTSNLDDDITTLIVKVK